VRDVALGMGYDPRIGSEFLHPGPGFGGACLPKDTAALLHTAAQFDYDFSLLRGVLEVNERQRRHMIRAIRAMAGGELRGKRVAVLGLTFKANTDDLRDSPAMTITSDLLDDGASVCAFDPVAGEAASREVAGLEIAADAYDACEGADVLAILTEWDQFRWLDYTRVVRAMAEPKVVDARNLLDPAAMRRLGFTYQGVGR
jgi:UDPglucose 6-dehydrogenase